jgi:hypothetical protein
MSIAGKSRPVLNGFFRWRQKILQNNFIAGPLQAGNLARGEKKWGKVVGSGKVTPPSGR